MTDNPHADLEIRCSTQVGTEEQTVQLKDGTQMTKEARKLCENMLTYEDDYIGMSSITEARREDYQGKVLKFRCDDCGETTLACPICADSRTPGWYRGEDTGKRLACHNCNYDEYKRQQRDPHR